MELADLVVGSAIALIGLWLAHNFRRQQRLTVAEERLGSYRDLWELMLVARTGRAKPETDVHSKGPFTPSEAEELHDRMNAWYFCGGRGMLLTEETKRVYLEAMRRLGDYVASYQAGDERRPEARHHGAGLGNNEGDLNAKWSSDFRNEGARRIRELSLLRSQMKYDVGIFGVSYFEELDDQDRDFLATAGVNPERWAARALPWYWRIVLLPRILHDWRPNGRRRDRRAARGVDAERDRAAGEASRHL